MGVFLKLGGPRVHGNSVKSHVIPAQAGIHLTWAPAFARATRMGVFLKLGGPQVHGDSVKSHVIPAKLVLRGSGRAGIQFLPDMDPRFRGGDGLTFISMGGSLAHDRSRWLSTSILSQRRFGFNSIAGSFCLVCQRDKRGLYSLCLVTMWILIWNSGENSPRLGTRGVE